MEPERSQEYKYTTDFNNGFTYTANRRKRTMATKPKFTITQPIPSEILFYKLIYTLQGLIYNSHNSIEATANFDFQPFLETVAMEPRLSFDLARTDMANRFRRLLAKFLQLQHLRSITVLGLLWKLQVDSSDAICE